MDGRADGQGKTDGLTEITGRRVDGGRTDGGCGQTNEGAGMAAGGEGA